MKPEIKSILLEASQNPKRFRELSEQYIEYLDANLSTIKRMLTASGFEVAFSKLWTENVKTIKELIQFGINVSVKQTLKCRVQLIKVSFKAHIQIVSL
jgi:hypothetical protein